MAPPSASWQTFEQFAAAVGAYMRAEILEQSYDYSKCKILQAQMRLGTDAADVLLLRRLRGKSPRHGAGHQVQHPFLRRHRPSPTRWIAWRRSARWFTEKQQATLDEVAAACAANFQGYERLRAKLLRRAEAGQRRPAAGRRDPPGRAAPRRADEGDLPRSPRRPRSAIPTSSAARAVTMGRATPATPDGRLAGTPVANSVAVSAGCELSGPTATLNSVCKLDAAKSWQCGYQVNIRFHAGMIADDAQREKLRAMLNVYFRQGGQELQINVVDSAAMRAAQKNPEQYRDLVVRVAGFSEFFVNLTPDDAERDHRPHGAHVGERN